MAAHGVHHAGPARAQQRLDPGREIGRGDHLLRAQGTQIVLRIRLAGHGADAIAALAEDVDGDAGNAAGGAGDQYLALRGRQPAMLHPVQGQRGRVTGRAQHGGIAQPDAGGQRQRPVMPHPRIFGIASVAVHADAKAVNDDLLAGLERRIGRTHHRARQVDAANARILADDAAAPGLRQRVLVVQARIGDLDERVARGQLVRRQGVVPALRRFTSRACVQSVGLEFGILHACLR